jgi:GPI mannosyltransferase 3
VDPSFPRSPHPCNPPGQSENKVEWEHSWPSHFVIFGALIDDNTFEGRSVRGVLEDKGYREIWMARNGFEEDDRRRGGVRLWQWMGDGNRRIN